jgi:hypothetical protein
VQVQVLLCAPNLMNKCMTVPRAGRGKERLAQIAMDAPLYSRPALIGDALYLVTAHRLYLIAAVNLRRFCPELK